MVYTVLLVHQNTQVQRLPDPGAAVPVMSVVGNVCKVRSLATGSSRAPTWIAVSLASQPRPTVGLGESGNQHQARETPSS